MKEKILLVDDEEGIRKVLGLSLADYGYQVITAKSGEEALGTFREIDFPIVLTDIKMPGMDGIELLKRIKEDAPDTEVIMLTGHGDMDLAIESLKYEAIDFITKPISDEALGIALKRARERITLREKLREYTENLEGLVQEKTQKLIEAERFAAMGQTVAGLAHAIKNITGGLSGGMFVAEKGIELDNKKYLLQGWEMVKKNVAKIKDLALDLLNFAKESEPDYQLSDANDPVREVYALMSERAQDLGVSLKLELSDDLGEVWLDPEGIYRCLLNLVTNALDACTALEFPKDTREITIRTLKTPGWSVEYQVVDNGCGMDQETLGMLFQQFFTTKGSRGTGLGLMLTKKIVDEHRGSIDAESQENKRTKFTIRLPGRGGE